MSSQPAKQCATIFYVAIPVGAALGNIIGAGRGALWMA
jgi:hypothetical protein